MKVLYATTNMRIRSKRIPHLTQCSKCWDILYWSMHPGVAWVKSDSWNRNLCGTTKRAYVLKIAT